MLSAGPPACHPARTLVRAGPCPLTSRTRRRRSFFLTSKPKVEQDLASLIQGMQDDVQKMTSQRARAERALMEAENEIRELLKASPELASKLATLAA